MPIKKNLFAFLISLCLAGSVAAQVPSWGLGPFVRPPGINPVIAPDTNAVFDCPMRQSPVQWEALHTFNPAAVVKGNKVYLIYRAEDSSGVTAIGAHTSRLGMAVSKDGTHFKRFPKPILFPADDDQKADEWTGGCEDPRIIESPDGTFVLTYTQWNRRQARLAVATSKDLFHWKKYGPVFPDFSGFSKSGAIICRISHGQLRAAKINGKYWMYWGAGVVSYATSDDLIHWTMGKTLLEPRRGKFDSALVESGPPPVLTDKGIVMLYNAENDPGSGDASLPPNVYTAGQALFDSNDPTRLLARADEPFYKPEAPFERSGQYTAGTTFIEGLVLFKSQWFLYYGCADSFVGAAVWNPEK